MKEVIVDEFGDISCIDLHIFSLMELPLQFLKQAKLVAPHAHPR